ncbi:MULTISPECIES: NADH:flavin oxidoreductase/NADH oxidase [unclassified Pseudoalteromonas]|uniref:NADH:flavin oxidoreductase/NADH oxidase n=1 Tax=unclassified Pseudoalteromonas TaxID=194690 RepID=UPI0006D65B4F|nr:MULTISPECIES: NADH:flavin oxidoreductase/NADH oxidase [unclassified Pseudoalteromonas]KPZ57176.1 NADPH dehydrogenase [Pseudoalteromonas sp. P1-25]KPZ59956.1 NADPH dehydrogenase [Pseudoalteromonas sp. P1-7a]
MSQLFSPLKLGELTLDNRIIIAPMCQYSAHNGAASDWHTIHLGQLSLSGAGLLILEATAVNPEGRISYGDLGLWNSETQQALDKSLKAVRQYSPMPIGIQLAHAGRKASTEKPWDGGGALNPTDENGWQTLAPSAVAYDDNSPVPKAMSQSDIDSLINDFVSAAKRADELGINLIELHAAHGYLLHQFLSPLSNKRDDEYGGSLQNRMRIVLDVFNAVRAEFNSSKPVGIRISATDWVEGGWDLDQSIALAKALDELGCDFMHVSTAGLSPKQQIPVKPNFQVPFATAIKKAVSMPVIAVGLITEPQQAENIVSEQQADGVALARGILYNPHWPWHAAAELGATVKAPKQYLRSSPHGQPSPIK